MNDIDYIIPILKKYHTAFTNKTYPNIKTNKPDALMDIFGITTELQEKNKRYWGRELGMIWQFLVTEVCKHHCHSFKPAFRVEIYEPCDLIVGRDAIDTKYRVGSGDSGTLAKFRQNSNILKNFGFKPIILIFRDDNLPSAIKTCEYGGWTVYVGQQAFKYIERITGVNLYRLLVGLKGCFLLHRS